MREIKFRAWDKSQKKMLSDKELMVSTFGNGDQTATPLNESLKILGIVHELMQFTGLKDKNGKEIYEGDIIDNEGARQKYEVIFHNGCFCISRGAFGYHIFDEKKAEIIGNVYEHPKLLNYTTE